MSDIDKNEPTLLENIRSGYDTFSKGQKRIAGYILDNYVSAAYMTAARAVEGNGRQRVDRRAFCHRIGL